MKGEAMAGSRNGRRRRLEPLLPVVCILGMILWALPGPASAQPGFVSVDCGASTGFKDTDTGISYVADKYIGTGVTGNVNTARVVITRPDFNTLRYFPKDSTPKKNCYQIPVISSTQYLVRAYFYHGDYAAPPASGKISFQLALDSSFWTDVVVNTNIVVDTEDNFYQYEEAIVMSKSTSLSVCLIRTGDGSSNSVPFISSLELRPLPKEAYLHRYLTPSNYLLYLIIRRDFGESSVETR